MASRGSSKPSREAAAMRRRMRAFGGGWEGAQECASFGRKTAAKIIAKKSAEMT